MTDRTETVHVSFGPSRSQSIRDALRLEGCEARVIGLPDALDFGPIDPPEPDVRREWIRTVLRCDRFDDRCDPGAPWMEATSPSVYPIYWVCMSDAGDHACFLEFVHRMAGRPFDIVDATGLDVTTADGIKTPWSLGIMRPTDIVASRLSKRRRLLSHAESDAALAEWSKLRTENAPLRIVQDGKLVSAPLTHFDTCLTCHATTEWEIVARLIGRTMHYLSVGVIPRGQSPNDVFLFGRVLALGEAKDLEIKGCGPGMRDYEVRLPAAL